MRRDPQLLDSAIAFCYVAFVVSGVYKSAWYFSWIPIDLTLILGAVTVTLTGALVATGRLRLTPPAVLISVLFGVFASYAVLSGLWTPSTDYYWSKSFRLVTVTGLTLGVGAVVIGTSLRRLQYAGFATVGLAVITAIETLYRYEQAVGDVELYPFGTNYLITGRLIGIGLLLTIGYLVLRRDDRFLSVSAIACTLVMSYALLVSGARGPMVTVAGSVGLLLLLGIKYGTLPNGRAAIAGYSVAAGLSALGLVTLAQQLRGIRRILALADGPGRSLGLRFEFWAWTIDALHPGMLLFGEGLGSWPVLVYHEADGQYYPHNLVLEVLFELGLVGIVLIGALLGYAVVTLFRDWRAHEESTHLFLVILFIYMLANVMVTGDLNENRYLFAIVGAMAYSVSARRYTVREILPINTNSESPPTNT